MRDIKKKLSAKTNQDELIFLFKISYKEFKKFWTIQNFTFTLDASLGRFGKQNLLEKYQSQIMKMRQVTADRTQAAENLIDQIIKYLAQKMKINRALLFNSTPQEIINNNLDLKEAKRRSNKYFLIAEKGKVLVFSDPEIVAEQEKYLNKIIKQQNIKLDKITGKVAYSGIVSGLVRIIIQKNSLKSIKKNEILVTPMTQVDYTPYLKKVSAIVTDEGGITCHAAIISRELKKPCIIGTKIATKVLKDGDLVEVDADKGIVKILKKAK